LENHQKRRKTEPSVETPLLFSPYPSSLTAKQVPTHQPSFEARGSLSHCRVALGAVLRSSAKVHPHESWGSVRSLPSWKLIVRIPKMFHGFSSFPPDLFVDVGFPFPFFFGSISSPLRRVLSSSMSFVSFLFSGFSSLTPFQ
jgi:hypothetical protein